MDETLEAALQKAGGTREMTQTTQNIDAIHEMYEYNIAGSSLADLFCLKKQKHQESLFHTRDTKSLYLRASEYSRPH